MTSKVSHQRFFVDGFHVTHGVVGTAGQGRAVDHDVQAAQLLHGGINHTVHLVGLSGVHLHGDHGAARGVGDFPGGGLKLVHGTGSDNHVAALIRQDPRDCFADAPSAAGDEGLLALKSKIHIQSSCAGLLREPGPTHLPNFWILHKGRVGGNMPGLRKV